MATSRTRTRRCTAKNNPDCLCLLLIPQQRAAALNTAAFRKAALCATSCGSWTLPRPPVPWARPTGSDLPCCGRHARYRLPRGSWSPVPCALASSPTRLRWSPAAHFPVPMATRTSQKHRLQACVQDAPVCPPVSRTRRPLGRGQQAPFRLDPDEATIWIVDDDEVIDREIISVCLERLRWPARIQQGSDGEEAWNLLPSLRRPAIVVTAGGNGRRHRRTAPGNPWSHPPARSDRARRGAIRISRGKRAVAS